MVPAEEMVVLLAFKGAYPCGSGESPVLLDQHYTRKVCDAYLRACNPSWQNHPWSLRIVSGLIAGANAASTPAHRLLG